MPEQQPNQSILLDVYQRLGAIESKVDDVRQIRQTADNADAKADRALLISEQNSESIVEMRKEAVAQKRWLIGTIVGGVFSTASVVIAVLSLVLK